MKRWMVFTFWSVVIGLAVVRAVWMLSQGEMPGGEILGLGLLVAVWLVEGAMREGRRGKGESPGEAVNSNGQRGEDAKGF